MAAQSSTDQETQPYHIVETTSMQELIDRYAFLHDRVLTSEDYPYYPMDEAGRYCLSVFLLTEDVSPIMYVNFRLAREMCSFMDNVMEIPFWGAENIVPRECENYFRERREFWTTKNVPEILRHLSENLLLEYLPEKYVDLSFTYDENTILLGDIESINANGAIILKKSSLSAKDIIDTRFMDFTESLAALTDDLEEVSELLPSTPVLKRSRNV